MLELTSFGGVRAATRDAIKRIFACAPSNLEVTPSSTSSSILTDQFHDSQDAGMSELPEYRAVHALLSPVKSRRMEGCRAFAVAPVRILDFSANALAIDLRQDP